MPGKTPDKEPVENGGYRGGKPKPKGKKTAKEGDDEMTVVVPPSKKQSSAPPPNDADGDVAMDEAGDGEAKVDPVVQTVNGMRGFLFELCFKMNRWLTAARFVDPKQISRATSRS